jgi:hypothetical protein
MIRFVLYPYVLFLSILLVSESQSDGRAGVGDVDDVVVLLVDVDRSIVAVEECDIAEQQEVCSATMFDV